MALLFIICIIFFIACIGYGIFYLIKGIINKEFHYIKTSIICFGIAFISLIIPFYCISVEIAEAIRN